MPRRVHIDHDVSQKNARLLRDAKDADGKPRYDVVTAKSLSMTTAPDYAHLSRAADGSRVLISCN